MRYFNSLQLLLGLFIIPIGFAYANDSSSLKKLTFDDHSIKKRCCFYTSNPDSQNPNDAYYVNLGTMGYQTAADSTVLACTRFPAYAQTGKLVTDPTATVVAIGQYGDQNDKTMPDGTYPKKNSYVKCVVHRTVCGYADASVPANQYNATNCKVS